MKLGIILKKGLMILISLLVLWLILAWMSGTFHKKIEPGRVAAAKRTLAGQPTDEIHKIEDVERIPVAGALRAERRSEVSPKVLAAVLEMTARAGQRVAKGAVLARLDDRDLKAQLEQARQAAASADAALQNADRDYQRKKDLVEKKVISRQEFDAAEAQFKMAQAGLQRAKEAVSSAETLLSYTVIEAPIAGIIVDKLADVGDTASPGRPLFTLYDPSGFRLEAAAPETLASPLQSGDSIDVQIDAVKLSLKGKIVEIVPQAETASRSVLVKVQVPLDPRMVDGMSGRLLIPSRKRIRYCVPLSAVQEIGQLRFVDVVGKDGELERRMIRLGEHSERGRIEALSGVEAGERVVLYGPPPPPYCPPGENCPTPKAEGSETQ